MLGQWWTSEPTVGAARCPSENLALADALCDDVEVRPLAVDDGAERRIRRSNRLVLASPWLPGSQAYDSQTLGEDESDAARGVSGG